MGTLRTSPARLTASSTSSSSATKRLARKDRGPRAPVLLRLSGRIRIDLCAEIASLVTVSRKTRRAARAHGRQAAGSDALTSSFEASWLQRAVAGLVSIKVAGLVVIFDPASAQAFDGAKASFSLATAALLVALIALAFLTYGAGILVRTRLHLVAGGVVLANVAAVVFAQERYVALFGAQRHLGLTFVLDMFVLYVAVSLAFLRVRDWAVLAAGVACAGVVTVGYGLLQYAGLDPIPWANYTRERPPSTFGNSDKFGHFLAVTLLAAVGLAIVPLNGRDRRLRMAALLYAAAGLAAAALIASRGALLGVAAAAPALVLAHVRLHGIRPTRRSVVAGAGAATGLVVLSVALLMLSPLGERIRGGFADVASQQRLFVADAALRAFRDRPLTGFGPDSFGVIYPQYRPPSSVAQSSLVTQDSAHSWLLQALATTGAIGALTLAALAAGTILLLWRGCGSAPRVALPLLAGAVGYWGAGLVAIGSPSVDWIAWVAAGGAATFGRRPVVGAVRRVAPPVQAIVVTAALALAIAGLPAFQASRELNTARAAQQAGRADRAIPAAERAVQLDSGRAEHWYALGLARQERRMLAGAADAFRAAADRAPYVSGYWASLALTLANLALSGDSSLGGKDAALAAARRGIEADPYYPAPYHALALVASGLGEHASALEASATAIRLYKGEPEYEAVAADAALRLQDAAAARSALERIVGEKDAPVLRVALARVSLKLNDTIAARAHLRRALELDPQYAPALELVKQLGS